MAFLAEYKVNGNENIRIEVEEVEGFVLSGPRFNIYETNKKFEDIISNLDLPLNMIYDKIENIKNKPKNISIEFGLKFAATSEAFIASASVAAQFKITATWEGMTNEKQ